MVNNQNIHWRTSKNKIWSWGTTTNYK